MHKEKCGFSSSDFDVNKVGALQPGRTTKMFAALFATVLASWICSPTCAIAQDDATPPLAAAPTLTADAISFQPQDSGDEPAVDSATEYGRLVRSPSATGALDNGLLGESVDFYTGQTDFVATDVSLPLEQLGLNEVALESVCALEAVDMARQLSDDQFDQLLTMAEMLQGLLSSHAGLVEVARYISSSRFLLKQENNPLFLPFVGIDSATDHFPLGEVREHFAFDVLQRYDRERAATEKHYAQLASASAANLLRWVRTQTRARYSTDSTSSSR